MYSWWQSGEIGRVPNLKSRSEGGGGREQSCIAILASARVSAAGDHEHVIWKLNNSELHVTPYNIHTQAGRIDPLNKHQKRAQNTFQCCSHDPLPPPSLFPTNTVQKDSHSHEKNSSVSYTADLPIQKLRIIRLGKHASVLLLSLLLLSLLLLSLLHLPWPLSLLSLLLCPPLPPCAVVD